MFFEKPVVVSLEAFNGIVDNLRPDAEENGIVDVRDRAARFLGFSSENHLIAYQNRDNRPPLSEKVADASALPKRLVIYYGFLSETEDLGFALVTGSFPGDSDNESNLSSVVTTDEVKGDAPRMIPMKWGGIAGSTEQEFVEINSDRRFFGLTSELFSQVLDAYYGVTRSMVTMPRIERYGSSALSVPYLFEEALLEQTGLLPHPDMNPDDVFCEDSGDDSAEELYLELTLIDD